MQLISKLFFYYLITLAFTPIQGMEFPSRQGLDASFICAPATTDCFEQLMQLAKEKYIEDMTLQLRISGSLDIQKNQESALQRYERLNIARHHYQDLTEKIEKNKLWIMFDLRTGKIISFVELYLVPTDEKESLVKKIYELDPIVDDFSSDESDISESNMAEENSDMLFELEEETSNLTLKASKKIRQYNIPHIGPIIASAPSPIAVRQIPAMKKLYSYDALDDMSMSAPYQINPFHTHICIGEKYVTNKLFSSESYRTYPDGYERATAIMNGIIKHAIQQLTQAITQDLSSKLSLVPTPGTTPIGTFSLSTRAYQQLEIVLFCYDMNQEWIEETFSSIQSSIRAFQHATTARIGEEHLRLTTSTLYSCWTLVQTSFVLVH